MDLELRGKSVLIKGGSKGIGLACAHGFGAEGARVHMAARTESALKVAADAIARQRKLGDASRWQEIQAKQAAAGPTRRTGQPSQVSDLVVFRTSVRASHISGTIVTIDNGNSVRVRG